MSRPATLEEADAFVAFMAKKFGVRIVRKDDAPEFKVIQAILGAFSLPDLTKELDRWSFTLGPLIYLRPDLSADDVFEVVPHECTHARQWARDGLSFPYFYVTSGPKRVEYEVEAQRASMELIFARTRALPTLDVLIDDLRHIYAFGQADLDNARDLLEVAGTPILRGLGARTEEGRAAVGWMRDHAEELLA